MRHWIALALVMLVACDGPANHIVTVHQFQTLKNSGHDEATLQLFAEDASLHFGPLGTLTGHAAIDQIHGYDRALRTQLSFEDCVQTGQVVACRTSETNDWLATAGIESLNYDETRFEFDREGRIKSVSAVLSGESMQQMGAAMAAFDTWARAHRPEPYAELFSAEGAFVYSFDNGEKVLALLRQWQADESGAL
ncbi:MAG: hypothetical protein QNJ14_08495 [Woeseiaceae bacterium]|nr:hypothetical protein [Woeseiaceae bacterium]